MTLIERSIDKLPSGALRVRVYGGVDPVSKRPHYLVETIPPGPDAEQLARKSRTKLANQVDEKRGPRTKATVNELLDKYFEVANLDPSTLRGYQRNHRKHIKPLIGSTKVGAVDAQALDSFYAELRRCRDHCDASRRRQIDRRTEKPHDCDGRCRPHVCKPLAGSTVRQVHFILSGAFKRAVRWDWIARNPAAMAEPPAAPKPEPQPPTPEEAAQIVNAAWNDPEWGALVWLAMTTGARRGEICALRWRHVDLQNGTLSVHRSIDQDGSVLTEKETKSHQHRRIALDPETNSVLRDHRNRREELAGELGIDVASGAFVFSSAPDGREPLRPDTVTQRYARLADQLGIATTFHKLRHFSATELIAAGVDPRTVGGRLGHGSGGATTLRVYSAWVAESDQRASKTLSSRMPARPKAAVDRAERAKEDPRAPYEKIAADIRRRIVDGDLTPGTLLPSEKVLAETHSVSPATAHRAVELLKAWRLVEVSRGKRAAVLDRHPSPTIAPT